MALDLTDCQFQGPALPEPFVKFELEKELTRRKLLVKATGDEGEALQDRWTVYRRKLRELAASGGSLRVRNHVIEPLVELLGFSRMEDAEPVQTREDREAGGTLLRSDDGETRFRVWTTSFNEDLYAPARRGRAYRFSHLRVAQRVLLATGERAGLLTNGVHLMLLVSDPARPDSAITIPLDPGWKRSRDLPDSFRFLLAVASPEGLKALPDIVDKARLHQTRVTKELRVQARQAVERFIQEVLDHPDNRVWLAGQTDLQALAHDLWREGLVIIYRLLFILKGESSDDPARTFNFASTSLWRTTYSPSMALAPYARDVIERGVETGELLERGLRTLFRMFEEGLECTELVVKPLGGALFGKDATPTLADRTWGERAVAWLLDRLLWTPKKRGVDARERVHYGSLWVEDLGRVYEALLELEPGISTEPMCRLRRQKLEVVVPLEQGEPYRPTDARIATEGEDLDTEPEDEDESEEVDEAPRRGKKTKVEWIEAIPPGRFYLRVGLGRKASGSYYTPHSFVRFLVQETLGPQVAERSPNDDPKPGRILELKVLDPAMGSGHFLVEACRFLGAHLYEAARLCDERALDAELRAERAKNKREREAAEAEAREYRQRVIDLPDPDDEIVRYLPSRSPEAEESGVSQRKAEALCRRMVAVHCLYGVDKNPLAVELAKLALWLESHAEGMPLTFLDHRLVMGDSVSGPFLENLTTRPGNPEESAEGVLHLGLEHALQNRLTDALSSVQRLEATVGVSLSETDEKQRIKRALDQVLRPFRIVAAAWSGGVMLGPAKCDDVAYADLLKSVAETGESPEDIESERLLAMIARGLGIDKIGGNKHKLQDLLNFKSCVPALAFDIVFPEVFLTSGTSQARQGFHVVLSNPPWDRIEVKEEEYWSQYDLEVLSYGDKEARQPLIEKIAERSPVAAAGWQLVNEAFEQDWRIQQQLYFAQTAKVEGRATTGRPDFYRIFAERGCHLLKQGGKLGWVLPSGFHANEGATGIRKLYLYSMSLECCYSFQNRKKLFEIDSRQKFAAIVATSAYNTEEFACAFYLEDPRWLYGERDGRDKLVYRTEYVERVGGEYFTFPECRSQIEADLLGIVYRQDTTSLDSYLEYHDLDFAFGVELHRNRAFNNPMSPPKFGDELLTSSPLSLDAQIPICRGKSFWQFSDRGEFPVDVVAPISVVMSKGKWNPSLAFYRIVFRETASSTNERTLVCALLRPGLICNHKAGIEIRPWNRPNAEALALLTVFNSFFADWQVRQKAGTNVGAFVFRATRLPDFAASRALLSRTALRLVCNHSGYKPLWQEQLGDAWREEVRGPFDWPVLAGNDARWEFRAVIDAGVADAYGLSRDQYKHVLSTFSHASYPKAPELCLAKFDELKRIGLDAFTRKYDPYHDIPLNENLPQPVINLPLPEASMNAQTEADF